MRLSRRILITKFDSKKYDKVGGSEFYFETENFGTLEATLLKADGPFVGVYRSRAINSTSRNAYELLSEG